MCVNDVTKFVQAQQVSLFFQDEYDYDEEGKEENHLHQERLSRVHQEEALRLVGNIRVRLLIVRRKEATIFLLSLLSSSSTFY